MIKLVSIIQIIVFLLLLSSVESVNVIGTELENKLNRGIVFENNAQFFLTDQSQANRDDTEIFLPEPISVDSSYRNMIMTRCSVRRFKSSESVEDEKLSTILWAAYGTREDHSRTIHPVEGLHSSIIYVFREEAVYTYNPHNHSLVFFQGGDLRRTVNWQHVAPIQLGLVWDSSINSDENYSSIELGEIGQNIYFTARALGLGTVSAGLTGFDDIELPEHHIGRIVMPLGYPQIDPILEYNPNLISLIPKIQDSDVNLITVIEERRFEDSFEGDVDRQVLSQLLWAAYGFSYYIDSTNSATNEVERHRTVPSASCVYPLVHFAVTNIGIFRYVPHILHLNPYSSNPFYSSNWEFPVISCMIPVRWGDYREDISQTSSKPDIASSPLIIVTTLQFSSSSDIQWYWFYEAGASAYNVMLESTLLNLHAGIVKPLEISSLNSILRLKDDYVPLLLIPVGE